jgi:hypothetical protein
LIIIRGRNERSAVRRKVKVVDPILKWKQERALTPGQKIAEIIHSKSISFQCVIKVPGDLPGVDVMITIFCDFRQFSAKQIGVFLKIQCYDQNFE